MNYRHIFHAGNIPDIAKHAVLTLVLGHLRAKETAFAVLDTHAGVGLYDLDDPRALKTNEAATGIKALLAAPLIPALDAYYAVLRKLNPSWDGGNVDGFRVYPGSPLIAFHMLREQDRLTACELHPEDAEALRRAAPLDKRLHIHCRDGYAALNAFLPPPEKRGLVLIDPPYEQSDEFSQLADAAIAAHRRWPTGIYMLWYPVKDRPTIWQFHEKLATSGMEKILCAEFNYAPEGRGDVLTGSGMIIINPPWKLDEQLQELFPALQNAIKTPATDSSVKWLTA